LLRISQGEWERVLEFECDPPVGIFTRLVKNCLSNVFILGDHRIGFTVSCSSCGVEGIDGMRLAVRWFEQTDLVVSQVDVLCGIGGRVITVRGEQLGFHGADREKARVGEGMLRHRFQFSQGREARARCVFQE